MSKFVYIMSLLTVIALSGCSAASSYENCVKDYEKQCESNGGNCGIAGPDVVCKKE